MRILVTGSTGHIGRTQVEALRAAGHELRTTDQVAAPKSHPCEHLPGDLRDLNFVRQAVQGMEAVVHLGAIASDQRGSGDQVLSVNVMGTLNVLMACVEAGVERIVNFSSINALGAVGGHRPAVQLPIDDTYPRHPLSPYQLSKHLGEEACTMYAAKHGLKIVSMRPGYVAPPEHYSHFNTGDKWAKAEAQKSEYWGYVDRRDVCEAVVLALQLENVTHDAFLLLADDTTLDIPSVELVERFWPDTPWITDRDAYFAGNPYRSVIDNTHAKQVLGWQPRYSWRNPASHV